MATIGEPKHTFAVLAYKASPFLEECIKSIEKQTVKSRIFLSTSTPSTFLQALSDRLAVQILQNDEAKGIAGDWSFAYNAADTQYVTLAHQDDVYYPEYVQHCLEIAQRHPDNLITFTGYDELYEGKLREQSVILVVKKLILAFTYLNRSALRHRMAKRALLAFGSPIPCPSVMYNKATIGRFEFSGELSVNMDWDAWMNLAGREGTFLRVSEKLVAHRIHADSQTTVGLRNNTRKMEDEMILRRIWPAPIARLLSHAYALSYKSNE